MPVKYNNNGNKNNKRREREEIFGIHSTYSSSPSSSSLSPLSTSGAANYTQQNTQRVMNEDSERIIHINHLAALSSSDNIRPLARLPAASGGGGGCCCCCSGGARKHKVKKSFDSQWRRRRKRPNYDEEETQRINNVDLAFCKKEAKLTKTTFVFVIVIVMFILNITIGPMMILPATKTIFYLVDGQTTTTTFIAQNQKIVNSSKIEKAFPPDNNSNKISITTIATTLEDAFDNNNNNNNNDPFLLHDRLAVASSDKKEASQLVGSSTQHELAKDKEKQEEEQNVRRASTSSFIKISTMNKKSEPHPLWATQSIANHVDTSQSSTRRGGGGEEEEENGSLRKINNNLTSIKRKNDEEDDRGLTSSLYESFSQKERPTEEEGVDKISITSRLKEERGSRFGQGPSSFPFIENKKEKKRNKNKGARERMVTSDISLVDVHEKSIIINSGENEADRSGNKLEESQRQQLEKENNECKRKLIGCESFVMLNSSCSGNGSGGGGVSGNCTIATTKLSTTNTLKSSGSEGPMETAAPVMGESETKTPNTLKGNFFQLNMLTTTLQNKNNSSTSTTPIRQKQQQHQAYKSDRIIERVEKNDDNNDFNAIFDDNVENEQEEQVELAEQVEDGEDGEELVVDEENGEDNNNNNNNNNNSSSSCGGSHGEHDEDEVLSFGMQDASSLSYINNGRVSRQSSSSRSAAAQAKDEDDYNDYGAYILYDTSLDTNGPKQSSEETLVSPLNHVTKSSTITTTTTTTTTTTATTPAPKKISGEISWPLSSKKLNPTNEQLSRGETNLTSTTTTPFKVIFFAAMPTTKQQRRGSDGFTISSTPANGADVERRHFMESKLQTTSSSSSSSLLNVSSAPLISRSSDRPSLELVYNGHKQMETERKEPPKAEVNGEGGNSKHYQNNAPSYNDIKTEINTTVLNGPTMTAGSESSLMFNVAVDNVDNNNNNKNNNNDNDGVGDEIITTSRNQSQFYQKRFERKVDPPSNASYYSNNNNKYSNEEVGSSSLNEEQQKEETDGSVGTGNEPIVSVGEMEPASEFLRSRPEMNEEEEEQEQDGEQEEDQEAEGTTRIVELDEDDVKWLSKMDEKRRSTLVQDKATEDGKGTFMNKITTLAASGGGGGGGGGAQDYHEQQNRTVPLFKPMTMEDYSNKKQTDSFVFLNNNHNHKHKEDELTRRRSFGDDDGAAADMIKSNDGINSEEPAKSFESARFRTSSINSNDYYSEEHNNNNNNNDTVKTAESDQQPLTTIEAEAASAAHGGAYEGPASNSELGASLSASPLPVSSEGEDNKNGHNIYYWRLIWAILPLGATFGNLLVILAVYNERSLQSVTNYFIVSLAFADLFVGIIVMPFAVYVLVNEVWELSDAICDIYVAVDVTSSTASILNLVAISIDRYRAVAHPIAYSARSSSRRAILTIFLVWLISCCVGAPIILGLNTSPERKGTLCILYNSTFIFWSSLTSFYVPCIIMIGLYWRIFLAIRSRTKKAISSSNHHQQQQQQQQLQSSTQQQQQATLAPGDKEREKHQSTLKSFSGSTKVKASASAAAPAPPPSSQKQTSSILCETFKSTTTNNSNDNQLLAEQPKKVERDEINGTKSEINDKGEDNENFLASCKLTNKSGPVAPPSCGKLDSKEGSPTNATRGQCKFIPFNVDTTTSSGRNEADGGDQEGGQVQPTTGSKSTANKSNSDSSSPSSKTNRNMSRPNKLATTTTTEQHNVECSHLSKLLLEEHKTKSAGYQFNSNYNDDPELADAYVRGEQSGSEGSEDDNSDDEEEEEDDDDDDRSSRSFSVCTNFKTNSVHHNHNHNQQHHRHHHHHRHQGQHSSSRYNNSQLSASNGDLSYNSDNYDDNCSHRSSKNSYSRRSCCQSSPTMAPNCCATCERILMSTSCSLLPVIGSSKNVGEFLDNNINTDNNNVMVNTQSNKNNLLLENNATTNNNNQQQRYSTSTNELKSNHHHRDCLHSNNSDLSWTQYNTQLTTSQATHCECSFTMNDDVDDDDDDDDCNNNNCNSSTKVKTSPAKRLLFGGGGSDAKTTSGADSLKIDNKKQILDHDNVEARAEAGNSSRVNENNNNNNNNIQTTMTTTTTGGIIHNATEKIKRRSLRISELIKAGGKKKSNKREPVRGLDSKKIKPQHEYSDLGSSSEQQSQNKQQWNETFNNNSSVCSTTADNVHGPIRTDLTVPSSSSQSAPNNELTSISNNVHENSSTLAAASSLINCSRFTTSVNNNNNSPDQERQLVAGPGSAGSNNNEIIISSSQQSANIRDRNYSPSSQNNKVKLQDQESITIQSDNLKESQRKPKQETLDTSNARGGGLVANLLNHIIKQQHQQHHQQQENHLHHRNHNYNEHNKQQTKEVALVKNRHSRSSFTNQQKNKSNKGGAAGNGDNASGVVSIGVNRHRAGSRRRREKNAARRERKATKTLAIVLGIFLICWTPFFTCNIIDGFCIQLEMDCRPGMMVYLVTSWLGYINSCVNPIIYTIFNMEFRRAFKKILTSGEGLCCFNNRG